MRRERLSGNQLAGLVFVGFVVLTICVTAVVLRSLRYQATAGQDAPKVTDWWQAGGTIAAAVVGLLAALAAGGLFWHEWRQTRRAVTDQQEEEKRRHAERVTWYLRKREPSETSLRGPADAGEQTNPPVPEWISEAVLVVINSSDNCIYQVVCSMPELANYENHRYLARRGLGTVPPGQTAFLMPMWFERDVGSAATRDISALPTNRPVEYVQFWDPAGRAWRRYGQGELRKIPETAPDIQYPDYSY